MSTPGSSKAIAKIHRWKSNFLDLSNKNNQLNFNPQSKNNIEILSPDCASLFKMLIVLDQTCTFPPVFKTTEKRKSTKKKTDSSLPFEAIPEPVISQALKDKHQEALENAKKNARLTEIITELTDNILETRIVKLIRKNQEAEEERGINILYLTFGLLKWKDKTDPTYNYSPVLFTPLKLTTKPLSIDILDDEVIVNPALKEKLLGEQIHLPKFGYEFDSPALSKFFSQVEEEIAIEPSWELEKRAFISTFSFTKAPLFEDLDNHEDLLLNHPIIKAIAEEEGFIEEIENLPDKKSLGDQLNPSYSYAILDCDSSQMEAVTYAKSGSSLVIQGPPGTGKSQCIANIIAECLAVGKKVLFVAQKQAALNVVKKRLDKCGIGDFCLQVHSQNANKIEVLKQIEQSMNLSLQNPEIREGKLRELALIRNKLNEYVENINQKYGKIHLSLYEIYGKLLNLENVPLVEFELNNPNTISESEFVTIKDLFHQLENFRTTMENYNDNPWRYSRIVSPLIISSELHLVLRKLLVSFKKNNLQLQKNMEEFNQNFPISFLTGLELLSQWEKMANLGKYWIVVFRNLFDTWKSLDADYRKLSEFFELESVIDFEEFDFHSFKQIQLAYEEKIPENQTFNYFFQQKLSEYMQVVKDFYDKISVFNMKSNLKPIRNDSDIIRMKKFFDIYNANALLLDVDGLVARFTIDYTSWIKKRGPSFKEDKQSILSCLKTANSKANAMGHLNLIKSFQDEFGKPYTLSIEAIEDTILTFTNIIENWYALREIEEFLHPLFSVTLVATNIDSQLWEKNHNFAEEWHKNLPFLKDWFEVQVRFHHLKDLGVETLFNKLINQKFYYTAKKENDELIPIPYELIFEKAFYSIWLEDIRDSLPPIANFKRTFHIQEIKKFRETDSETLILNQLRIQKKLNELRPKTDLDIPQNLISQIGYIKRELKKKRNVKPLRQTFVQAKEYITMLKPCFLMSPLSIANYLAVEEYTQFFDIVIFDEASQVTPEDAIGAILRGKSLIVVGDSEQLPPTNFFTAQSNADEMTDDLDLDVDVQSMESLLDECTGIGFREKLLKFHYRSKKEGLIAFSNQNYYNGRLYSFPDIGTTKKTTESQIEPSTASTEINSNLSNKSDAQIEKELENELDRELKSDFDNTLDDILDSVPDNSIGSKKGEDDLEDYLDIVTLPAIDFQYVQNGRKIKGTNPIEAKSVAIAIANHFLSNHKFGTKYSLGIVAFSQAQQETIQRALEKLIKSHPEYEPIIYSNSEEPLFIKNLESVQGDERDFIFFSIGYAKDSTGKMGLNFGPLNRSGGYRRLNVAITRARYHIKLFSSFLPSDISIDRVKAKGLLDLIAYMRYARFGELPHHQGPTAQSFVKDPTSFEADVERTIEELGYQVEAKVGTSDFRIDLAVIDPKNPSKYILGIELDGGSYKDAENARDRDRIRYNVLSMLGWNIFHVWAPEWYQNKKKVVDRIKKRLS